jgi:hypothetical protein
MLDGSSRVSVTVRLVLSWRSKNIQKRQAEGTKPIKLDPWAETDWMFRPLSDALRLGVLTDTARGP